ncbi:probable ATP-dependent RNA helicase DHX35 [Cimex lectularius]|uniref:RNA helicase n=1 Tax=Cimex lectularius TaxID=79782 RepID=A0A8I6RXJ4_CIMLE|nr:probable ATP-dependent RNA helicase DHX35 [Cimex lectularius]
MSNRFLKPADEGGWQEDKSDVNSLNSTTFVFNKNLALVLEQQRKKLPIFKNRNDILFLLEKYQTLVLVGETGCGKSTQVPQYLLESGWCENGKIIGITEPRRVAATTLAVRVAEERGSPLGHTVGYSIRFDDCTDPDKTKIKYMTEGLLMREMMVDPLLRCYSVIMLDEVHERTLNTDILMGLLKKIIKKNTNLKLIIASATVDAELLQQFFNLNQTSDEGRDTSTILSVEGRLYPVTVHYVREPVADYVKATVETVLKIHTAEPQGDILAFLTGQEEVDLAVSLLSEHESKDKELKIYPLPMYGSLPNTEQIKVFRYTPKGMRKVILATNIAETSVTIPGVNFVIDCGFVKMRWFNAESFTDSLVIVPISQASAEQRAGRAGRNRPGKVYRLYSEDDYEKLIPETPSEMRRSELSGAVLQLKALGVDNVVRFSFPTAPPAKSLLAAMELLHSLGALTEDAQLTRPIGIQMAEFPLSPLHAKSLLKSSEMGCSEEMAMILALLQIENIFVTVPSGAISIKSRIRRRLFEVEEGDLITALNVYKTYLRIPDHDKKQWCYLNFVNRKALKRTTHLLNQMESLLRGFNLELVSCDGNVELLCKCIAAGFFPNAAYLHPSGVYKSVRGNQDLYIHPTSVLYTLQQPQWVVYTDTIFTQKLFMRELTVVKPEWLIELAPHFYHRTVDRG